jgi:SAM-dependent methyltransferase
MTINDMSYLDRTAATGLRRLYSNRRFIPRSFQDTSDTGFITVNLIERSIDLLAPEIEGDLLDVGCGNQPYRSYFTGVRSHKACDFDAYRGDVDFACSAHSIPMEDHSLDSILCTEVLEHVPDPLAVWREFNRLLRPGGRVLLTSPMYWPPHELPHDYYRYPEHGLRHLIRESGFDLLEIIPRGGPWAFWGQLSLHVMQRFFPFRWQRSIWNRFIIAIDRRSSAPRLTMGWTVLARKSSH